MPKEMEQVLEKAGKKQGLKGKSADSYIYGTMEKMKKAHKAKMAKVMGK